MALPELSEEMLLGDEEGVDPEPNPAAAERAVENEMPSLSLRAPMEQMASAPTQEAMPRQIEKIPDDVLIAYARRRLEARDPKRMSVGHSYDFARQVTTSVR